MRRHGLWSRAFSQASVSIIIILALAAGQADAFEVSPEIMVDNPVYTLPDWDDQRYPAIAFNGSIYFAVWYHDQYSFRALVGARINQNGELLDQVPIIIQESGSIYNPLVTTDGDTFLVVWSIQNSPMGTDEIYAARVNPTGELLDPNGFIVYSTQNEIGFPHAAFDGTNYMLVYHEQHGGSWGSYDIMGARISPAGEVLDPGGFYICYFDGWQTDPDIAFNGENYLVAWVDARNLAIGLGEEIYGNRVSPDGEVLDPEDLLIASGFSDQDYPFIASVNADYMVIWNDCREGSDHRLYGARVAATGEVLDPQPFPISQTGIDESYVSITSDGADYLIIWGDKPAWRTRIAPDGTFLDPEPVMFSDLGVYMYGRKVISNGTAFFTVWTDNRLSSYDVYGARISADGEMLDQNGLLYSVQSNSQNAPAAAYDGANYLVVWEDDRNAADGQDHFLNIYGARITPEGTVLEPEAIPISIDVGYQSGAVAAFNGQNYLVVWMSSDEGAYDSNIYGTRVSPAGQVLDPGFITVSAGDDRESYPAVTSDGQYFFVSWQDERLDSVDIFGARIDNEGNLLDPIGFPISRAAHDQYTPTTAFGTYTYLVAWSDLRHNADDALEEIYGARVLMDGTVLDQNGFPIALNGNSFIWPALAYGHQEFLVVWTLTSNANIMGNRVDEAGQVLDANPISISNAAEAQSYPKVTYDGMHFFVVWRDNRSGNLDIYGARVSAGGTVLDPDGQIISADQEYEYVSGIASGSQGQTLVAYDRELYRWSPPYDQSRVGCRLVNTIDDDTVDDDTIDDDTTDDDTMDDDTTDDDTTDDDTVDDDTTDDDAVDDDAVDDDAMDDDIADDDASDDDTLDDDTVADDDQTDDDSADGTADDDEADEDAESPHNSSSDHGQCCG